MSRPAKPAQPVLDQRDPGYDGIDGIYGYDKSREARAFAAEQAGRYHVDRHPGAAWHLTHR